MSNLIVVQDKSEFTTNLELNNVIEGDNTFRICGFVERFDNLKEYSAGKVFQFILNNGEGSTMQVVSWNDFAIKFSKKINFSGMVVLLDKIRPKTPKNPQYLKASCKFEFHAQMCTKLEVLGIFKENLDVQMEIKTYDNFESLRESLARKAVVQGYIKTPFGQVITMNKSTFISGAITDTHYKLQIVIGYDDSTKELITSPNNAKGIPVSLTGMVTQGKNGLLTLHVKTMADVQLINKEKISRTVALNGYHLIP